MVRGRKIFCMLLLGHTTTHLEPRASGQSPLTWSVANHSGSVLSTDYGNVSHLQPDMCCLHVQTRLPISNAAGICGTGPLDSFPRFNGPGHWLHDGFGVQNERYGYMYGLSVWITAGVPLTLGPSCWPALPFWSRGPCHGQISLFFVKKWLHCLFLHEAFGA